MTKSHACDLRMDLVTRYGEELVLKPEIALPEGEISGSMVMGNNALIRFIEVQSRAVDLGGHCQMSKRPDRTCGPA